MVIFRTYSRRLWRASGGMPHACPQACDFYVAALRYHGNTEKKNADFIALVIHYVSRLVDWMGLIIAGTDPTNTAVIIARHHRLKTTTATEPITTSESHLLPVSAWDSSRDHVADVSISLFPRFCGLQRTCACDFYTRDAALARY